MDYLSKLHMAVAGRRLLVIKGLVSNLPKMELSSRQTKNELCPGPNWSGGDCAALDFSRCYRGPNSLCDLFGTLWSRHINRDVR